VGVVVAQELDHLLMVYQEVLAVAVVEMFIREAPQHLDKVMLAAAEQVLQPLMELAAAAVLVLLVLMVVGLEELLAA
jgi:hypothetical protein